MNCKICKTKTNIAFSAKILQKYEEKLYKCDNCGFLSVNDAFWLSEAYENAINISDTGIIARNIYLYKIVSSIAYILFSFRKRERGGGIYIIRFWRWIWNPCKVAKRRWNKCFME